MKNSEKHKAILKISIDVFGVLDSGECSGNRLSESELANYGLKGTTILAVDGENRHECLTKIVKAIELLR